MRDHTTAETDIEDEQVLRKQSRELRGRECVSSPKTESPKGGLIWPDSGRWVLAASGQGGHALIHPVLVAGLKTEQNSVTVMGWL